MMRFGVALRPIPGELASGDAFAVVEAEDYTVVLLIDGLGHGPAAAQVAAQAKQLGEAQAAWMPEQIIRALDDGLVGSRGAVASVLWLGKKNHVDTAIFCGVGNVDLRFRGKTPFAPISTPGILGRRVRKIRAFEHPLSHGDTLVLYTDGISSRFSVDELPTDPNQAASTLLARFGKATDDAACVVVRWEKS